MAWSVWLTPIWVPPVVFVWKPLLLSPIPRQLCKLSPISSNSNVICHRLCCFIAIFYYYCRFARYRYYHFLVGIYTLLPSNESNAIINIRSSKLRIPSGSLFPLARLIVLTCAIWLNGCKGISCAWIWAILLSLVAVAGPTGLIIPTLRVALTGAQFALFPRSNICAIFGRINAQLGR